MAEQPLRLQLKVIPGATRVGVEWYGDKLKVKVKAVAEKGRANTEVLALLAARLKVQVQTITLVSGHTAALKIVEIAGISYTELLLRLPR